MATMEERMKLIEQARAADASRLGEHRDRLDEMTGRSNQHEARLDAHKASLESAQQTRDTHHGAITAISDRLEALEPLTPHVDQLIHVDAKVAGIITGQQCAGHAHSKLDARVVVVEGRCDEGARHPDNHGPAVDRAAHDHPETMAHVQRTSQSHMPPDGVADIFCGMPRVHFNPDRYSLNDLRNIIPDDCEVAKAIDNLRSIADTYDAVKTVVNNPKE